jgi:hypothetical protein
LVLAQATRKAQEENKAVPQARWFAPTDGEGELSVWTYTGGYWEAREARDWKDCPQIFT